MTKIEEHLSVADLEARYKTASDPIAKSHFHAIWLLAVGYSVAHVATLLSFSRRWVTVLDDVKSVPLTPLPVLLAGPRPDADPPY